MFRNHQAVINCAATPTGYKKASATSTTWRALGQQCCPLASSYSTSTVPTWNGWVGVDVATPRPRLIWRYTLSWTGAISWCQHAAGFDPNRSHYAHYIPHKLCPKQRGPGPRGSRVSFIYFLVTSKLHNLMIFYWGQFLSFCHHLFLDKYRLGL